jgi:hypothetical protein
MVEKMASDLEAFITATIMGTVIVAEITAFSYYFLYA